MKSISARKIVRVATVTFISFTMLHVTLPSAHADEETRWRPLHDGFPPAWRETTVGSEDQLRVTLGGHFRVRYERWENFNFDPMQDDDFLLGRIFLNADVRYGERLRLFVEGKSAGATSRDLPGGRRTLDVDTLALQNAYLDVQVIDPLRVRAGRQELAYGRQRLISPLDWANTRRTFDGAKAVLTHNDWQIDAFWVRPVEIRKYQYNKTDTDTDFFGVYAVYAVPEDAVTLDVYVLGLDRDDVLVGEVTAREERYTAGLRLAGKPAPGPLDFDVEGGYQFGDHGDRDIQAFFVSAELGARAMDWPLSPRAHIGFDYASGDRDEDEGKLQTFHQLFPLGNAFFGHIDMVGRQNVVAYSAGVTLHPRQEVRVHVTAHHFRRASTDDALYNAGGVPVRTAEESDASEIGTELDLRIFWTVTPKTLVMTGASRLWAGDFIKETGPAKDISFYYIALQQAF